MWLVMVYGLFMVPPIGNSVTTKGYRTTRVGHGTVNR